MNSASSAPTTNRINEWISTKKKYTSSNNNNFIFNYLAFNFVHKAHPTSLNHKISHTHKCSVSNYEKILSNKCV